MNAEINFIDLLGEVNRSSNGSDSDNSTIHDESSREEMKIILDVLMLVCVVVIMLGMGTEITWVQLWHHIKRPVGLGIGMTSQFFIMPLTAFALLLASGIEGLHATAILIISCSSGGVLSNAFTYFADGDLPLSVVMTTTSSLMAMFMLPANMWLYGRHFESVNLVIPYQKMTGSVIILSSPICVGMFLNWKLPRIAKWTTKITTYAGLLLVPTCCILEVLIFPQMFTVLPLKLYVIIPLLTLVGMSLGCAMATLLRQKVPVCKTIAIECGMQNIPLALTVITLSFSLEMQKDMVLLPWLYGFAMLFLGIIFCGIYQLHKRFVQHKTVEQIKLPNIKEGPEDLEIEDLMSSNHPRIEL